MTQITKYRAEDGEEFLTVDEALRHEHMLAIVEYIKKCFDQRQDLISQKDFVEALLERYDITPKKTPQSDQ